MVVASWFRRISIAFLIINIIIALSELIYGWSVFGRPPMPRPWRTDILARVAVVVVVVVALQQLS